MKNVRIPVCAWGVLVLAIGLCVCSMPAPAQGASDSTIDWAAEAAKVTAIDISKLEATMNSLEPTGPAPAGIKFAIIMSDAALEGNVAPKDAATAAAQAVGWEVQSYDGQSSADTQNKCMLQAISWGANVICCLAVEPTSIQQGLQEAKDAGILVVSGSNGSDDPNPTLNLEEGQLDFAFDASPDFYLEGKSFASWIVNNAGNQGKIVVFGNKEWMSVEVVQKGLLDQLALSNMDVDDVQYFTASQIGDPLGRQVVAYLESNPDCKYLYAAIDPVAASLVEALRQANITDVKIMSSLGLRNNIEYIRSGNLQVATAGFDNAYMGWVIVHQSIRLLNGKELAKPHDLNIQYCILDKNNLPETGKNWGVDPSLYQDKFLNLWK